jgi:hypothetical protein
VPTVLNPKILQILEAARKTGWVMEPGAKRLLSLAGISVPEFAWVHSLPEAARHAAAVGYPVAAKVVSPAILHKSDVGGVAVGIEDEVALGRVYHRFQEMDRFDGILVEPMVDGVELIVGGQIDYQFGPVVLVGIGGTGVEIYQDAAMRMAPLAERDVHSMVKSLKGGHLLKGYRGAEPIDFDALVRLVTAFSGLLLEIEDRIESIDLNPVKCWRRHCMAADARIMLKSES